MRGKVGLKYWLLDLHQRFPCKIEVKIIGELERILAANLASRVFRPLQRTPLYSCHLYDK